MTDRKILAIIPARGGSKGVPKKNIKLLNNKPLIAYTIEAALKSRYLDKIIVSTDSKEIAEVSGKYGAEIIKRPKFLSGDKAKVIDAVFHIFDTLEKEKYFFDFLVLLQPTSPLRTTKDIDEAIDLFLKEKPELLLSVYKVEPPPYWCFRIEKNYLKPIFGLKYFKNRGGVPGAYMPNGAIYISTPKFLRKNKSFYAKKSLPYIMPKERSIDIDYPIDFMLAELLIKRGL
jgi:CMP-N-acetylneuraminic acid synthetase